MLMKFTSVELQWSFACVQARGGGGDEDRKCLSTCVAEVCKQGCFRAAEVVEERETGYGYLKEVKEGEMVVKRRGNERTTGRRGG
jgi:hypothetical protein